MPLGTIDRPRTDATATEAGGYELSDIEAAQALPLAIDLPAIGPAIVCILRLIVETTVVPAVLFALLMPRAGLLAALGAATGWVWLAAGIRCWSQGRAPTTLLLSIGAVTGRALLALATSSSVLFLVQPVIGAAVAAAVFVGSALIGKPLTMHLARDFVTVPEHVRSRTRVRRMFRDIALIWGASRFAGAAMGYSLLHADATTAALGRGLFTPLITITTIALCVGWAAYSLRADGVRLRRAGTAPRIPAVALAVA